MISVGDRVPTSRLKTMSVDGAKEFCTRDFFPGRKIVLFAVPGAFTPTCSNKHLPGFLELADEIKAKGVDVIACVSVNDVFVMEAWGKDCQVGDDILMLADGNAEFAKAMGVELDLTSNGLGIRSRRFAMVVEDGIITVLNIEEQGSYGVSSAKNILTVL